MRWMLRLTFLVVILALAAIFGFTSYVKATDSPIVVRSPLQGTKVLAQGKWGVYPERIIPRYVRIEPLPSSIKLQGQVQIALPYHALLKNIQDYQVTLTYSLDRSLKPQEQQEIVQKGETIFQNYWKGKIESALLEQLNEMVESDKLPSEKGAKQRILEQLKQFPSLEIHFTAFPNLLNYEQLRNQIVQTLKQEQVAAKETAIELQAKQEKKRLALSQENLQDAIHFSIKQAQNLADSKVDPSSTFSILSLLLGKPAPFLSLQPRSPKEENS